MTSKIAALLASRSHQFHEVMQGIRNPGNTTLIDMSKDNAGLMALDTLDTTLFTSWMEAQLGGKIGWGGYLEHREMYRRSRHFDGGGIPRNLHLGIDLWAPEQTCIYCPLDGVVHSLADNEGFGNYGPTLIIEHGIEDQTFYTLYGHLSRASLPPLSPGQPLQAGQCIARLGTVEENGHWPPHLHFQVITDLMGHAGDFPGVAAMKDRELYETICPDPNLILGCH